MSNTRHSAPGSPFRQERYCSSRQFQQGLLANLVARRCRVISDRSERDLIYFVQLLSHEEGGLERLAAVLREKFADGIGTRSMHRVGIRANGFYSAAQVKAIRRDMPREEADSFVLKGEMTLIEEAGCVFGEDPSPADLAGRPNRYPVSAFLQACRDASRNLAGDLAEWCLNPERAWNDGGPWYFPGLKDALRAFMGTWIQERTEPVIMTEVSRKVHETLDYALEERCLVVIQGKARRGKTTAARSWCEMHPGRARYVQAPSSNDENSFYRSIAKALGIGAGLTLKGSQIRQKVEDTLQTGDLMLVIDEAHLVWPQQARVRDSLPRKLNWIMTDLVNYRVPVALVATPQFSMTQRVFEEKSHWASEQFIGRISHFERLPEELNEQDLRAVAQALLPEGSKKGIQLLVDYAMSSRKDLAAIESGVKRARFLARKAGRAEAATVDIREAITGGVAPSDTALALALGQARSRRKASATRTDFHVPADRVQSPCREPAKAPAGKTITEAEPALAGCVL